MSRSSAAALRPAEPQPPLAGESYALLALESVVPSGTNPRKHFDDNYLDQLANSIREKGLVQPILVRPKPDRDGFFEIVAGECRFRASTRAATGTIPAIIRALSDESVLELQLIENIHRRDLTPLEQAKGYRALIDSNPTKHSAESIATRLGVSPAWVWDRMKLNDLVPEAKKILDRELITVGHAILIARLKPADQERVIAIGGDRNDYTDGGLWTEDVTFEELEDKNAPKDKYRDAKAVSIRELTKWIDDHVRFDVAHAAKATPLQFEDLAAKVATAEAQPGRGRKVVAITYDHFTQPEARSEDERTYGAKSWKRADGTKKTTLAVGYGNRLVDSPTCEHAVLGVVAAGERRGESFDVCIARDKCDIHWKSEKASREKSAKLRASGRSQQADQREAAAEKRREDLERQKQARWKHFSGELKKGVLAALKDLPAALSKPLYAKILSQENLPPSTKPADLPRAMCRATVARVFNWPSPYNETRLVAWAKLLGVDVKACEPKPVQTSGVEKKGAKAKKGGK